MNSTRASTLPNLTPDLPNRSTDLRKTLGIVGTPHGESIAKFMSTKTFQIKRNRRNHAKNSSNPRTPKPQNRAPLLTTLGGELKGEEPRRIHTYIPHQIPKRKVSKTLHEIHQERAPKITKKNEREQHIQALRNHVESSIHHKEVHTKSSLQPDHPSLSQDFTMKLSS
jgi:CRISPR/Cas system endoribonuclease Cas6 (RAMP superfamily)